jgi:hypothetical protein
VAEDDDIEVAKHMKTLVNKPNLLYNLVKEKKYDKLRKVFKKIDACDINEIPDFPVLTLEHLKQLTLGSYQLKQSCSYIAQHLDETGYIIESIKIPGEYIIRNRLRSHHKSQARYNVFIRYNPQIHLNIDWCCDCPVGLRTVGCCSHIASIIYYLGYARHVEDPHPAVQLTLIFPDVPPVDISETSDDENEDE